MNYRDILNQHRQITKVEIEPAKHAKDFWGQFIDHSYSAHNSVAIYESMVSFRYEDNLEIVNRQGRLLRRFGAYHKKRTLQVLTDAQAGIIGDKLQYFLSRSAVYYVDFTDEINWRDGQFGKDDSCWWGCYADSIPTYENGGGWAIRFYNDENQNDDNGIGRTWVLPHAKSLVCFNSYGIERPSVSKVIKAIFAQHNIELHYQTAQIRNSNSETIPYINDGSGFVLSEDEEFEDTITLSMPVARIHFCNQCGIALRKDGAEIRGHYYCKPCIQEHLATCEICNIPEHKYSVHFFEGKHTCEDCLRETGTKRCGGCGAYSRNTVKTHELEFRCENCRTFTCQKCQTTYAYRDNCPCGMHKEAASLFARRVEEIGFTNIPRRRRAIFRHKQFPDLLVFRFDSLWYVFEMGNFLGRYRDRKRAMYLANLLFTRTGGAIRADEDYYALRRIERENPW